MQSEAVFKLSAAEVINLTHTRARTHTPTHTHRWMRAVSFFFFCLTGLSSALCRLTVTVNGAEEFTRNLPRPLFLSHYPPLVPLLSLFSLHLSVLSHL